MKTRTLFAVALVLCALASSVSCNVSTSVNIENHGLIEYRMQYVMGDRIFDGTDKEVAWRGAGGSYLFHATDYLTAWRLHLPEIQAMGSNTFRLAFAFPDSSPNPEYGTPSADIMDYAKLDKILDFLDRYNIKAILDLHNYRDMYGDFGSQKLIDDWASLASRYRGDSRIVAYELFNEPLGKTWASCVQSEEDVLKAYVNLTDAIRKVDPEHIVIWQSADHLPPDLENYSQYFPSNLVFTVHRWYRKYLSASEVWTPEQLSYMTARYLVDKREKLNVPFWLGEFGSSEPFDLSNPEWLLTEQLLFRCEEQAIGWNLWEGRTAIDKPWDAYLPFFSLEAYNYELIREPFHSPVPRLTDYVIEHQGADKFESYRMQMWHNGDYVMIKPEITVLVITNHKSTDGSFEIAGKEETKIIKEITIRNEEGTTAHPGDWNIIIYALSFT